MESSKPGITLEPISCPYCAQPMVGGTVVIRDTFWSRLLAPGVRSQALFFMYANSDRTFLMRSNQNDQAYWCAGCKTMVSRFQRAQPRRKPKWFD